NAGGVERLAVEVTSPDDELLVVLGDPGRDLGRSRGRIVRPDDRRGPDEELLHRLHAGPLDGDSDERVLEDLVVAAGLAELVAERRHRRHVDAAVLREDDRLDVLPRLLETAYHRFFLRPVHFEPRNLEADSVDTRERASRARPNPSASAGY